MFFSQMIYIDFYVSSFLENQNKNETVAFMLETVTFKLEGTFKWDGGNSTEAVVHVNRYIPINHQLIIKINL